MSHQPDPPLPILFQAKKARTAAAGFDPYAQNVCRSVLSGDAQPESTSLIEATEVSSQMEATHSNTYTF